MNLPKSVLAQVAIPSGAMLVGGLVVTAFATQEARKVRMEGFDKGGPTSFQQFGEWVLEHIDPNAPQMPCERCGRG